MTEHATELVTASVAPARNRSRALQANLVAYDERLGTLLSSAGIQVVIVQSGGVQTPMTVRQLEARMQGGQDDDFANTPERELLPLPTPTRMDQIRKRVVEHAKEDPETVARLVRVWLNDEKNK